ncbi:lytic transglycosylase domain-containing protein [Microvirga arsenatis]|uniref:Transglycosylase SLT domain-containing protein n=1 Tax=Microvirga arsenatis TaxID=2692265 RepID=A0ABW9YYT6_9HYPH|nr:lytic transglycosylase domain-containing protein [Microvirga arsenatis]NBJ10955.1 transglycosylase SLT domain-containing protein [Microvirga arsenatis]NBJ25228.1 transglycosylase SLT domain-containing protein [Microvirga arsenatis]
MRVRLALCSLVLCFGSAWANPAPTETVEQALCRLIESTAQAERIPHDLLTRLIWQESSFRPRAVSPAGAQGIAQFMPGTARERGLTDPFDPEQAIPKAAEFMARLAEQFGNLGLAAAAYNSGPARVASWLAGRGHLPDETRDYVRAVTGKPVEEWAAEAREKNHAAPAAADRERRTCREIVAALRIPGRGDAVEAPFAPWGVQLAGHFSKDMALAIFRRASLAYAPVLKDVRPMIIGTRLRSRGTRTFYRVRAPAETRQAAEQLCRDIRSAGGSCIVLPS